VDPNDRYQSARDLLDALEREIRSPQDPHAHALSAGSSSRWWWEFHQAIVAIVYAVMVWPAWIARSVIRGREGDAVFVAVLAAAIVAVTLRLHLWFTSRFYPAELAWARARAIAWILGSDAVFAAATVVGGGLIGESRPVLAAIQIAVGIAAAVAFTLIEPATARAAFRLPEAVDSSRS
jgi:hypothetical protein